MACTILEGMERGAPNAVPDSDDIRVTSKKGTEIMKTTNLHIDGMHCDGCARTVEALLSRVPGVRKAEASFDERQARVLHDQNEAPIADLMAAVAKAGFEVKIDKQ